MTMVMVSWFAPVVAAMYFWLVFKFLPARLSRVWRLYAIATFAVLAGLFVMVNVSLQIGRVLMAPGIMFFVVCMFIRPDPK